MDNTQIKMLWQLSRSAYEAELNCQFDKAYSLHESAIAGLKELTQSLTFFSTEEREEKRIANRKVDLHRERLEALRPCLKGGSGSSHLLIPPSAATADQSLVENHPALSAVRALTSFLYDLDC
jgi:hypothetical protein